jgi:hypothetical protein
VVSLIRRWWSPASGDAFLRKSGTSATSLGTLISAVSRRPFIEEALISPGLEVISQVKKKSLSGVDAVDRLPTCP